MPLNDRWARFGGAPKYVMNLLDFQICRFRFTGCASFCPILYCRALKCDKVLLSKHRYRQLRRIALEDRTEGVAIKHVRLKSILEKEHSVLG